MFSKNRYEIINDSLRNFNEIKLENLSSFFENKYYSKENSINKISKKFINHKSFIKTNNRDNIDFNFLFIF